MTTVTFPQAYGGDGSSVSDDTNPDTGLRNGGHRSRFIAALVQMVAMLGWFRAKFDLISSYVLTVLNSPTTNATSTTSLSLADSGDLTLTLQQSGKAFAVGMTVGLARTSDGTKQMIGIVKTFTPGVDPTKDVMVVTMLSKTATAGPFTDWTVFRTASGSIPATRSVLGGGLATGGGDMSADRTITVSAASATEGAAGSITNKAMTPGGWSGAFAAQALTDGSTINTNFAVKRRATVTLQGDRLFANPTGCVEGGFYEHIIYQDGTGSREATWDTCYDFGLDEVPDLPETPGAYTTVYHECLSVSPLKLSSRYSHSAA